MLTEQEVLDAHILPTVGPILGLGENWFKDIGSGICYQVVTADGFLVVSATRLSVAPKITARTRTIKCSECDEEREIRTQDSHQVGKCRECQYQSRLAQRRRYLARKRGEK